MADKMMRIAGRGKDGTAKSLRTDNEGRIETATKVDSRILMNETGPGTRTLAPGETWESPVFLTGDLDEVNYNIIVSRLASYSMRVTEMLEKEGHYYPRPARVVLPNLSKGQIIGRFKVYLPAFSIHIQNHSDEPLNVGVYMYLRGGK